MGCLSYDCVKKDTSQERDAIDAAKNGFFIVYGVRININHGWWYHLVGVTCVSYT